MTIAHKNTHTYLDLEKRFGVMTLGKFIKAFREADGISQVKYSQLLGISRAHLCDVEQGRRQPSPIRLKLFAKRMGVTTEVLLKLYFQDLLRDAKLHFMVELKAA